MQTLLRLLVILIVLYGWEVWASSTSDLQWRQIEKIKKHMITSKFKIKSSVPYEIMLSEMGMDSIEAIAMLRLIRYLKRVEQMEEGRWPKVVFHDIVQKKEDLDVTKY